MLKRNIKKIFESISGYKIAKYGTGSFFFANKRLTGDLWFFYEMELASIFEKYKVNLVIDVGANRGQFSTHLRDAVQYKGKIASFEPVSHIFHDLLKIASDDDNWDVYNYALGNENTIQKIHVSEQSVFSSFLETNEYCAQHFGKQSVGLQEEAVTVRRLEEVVAELTASMDSPRIFLKMDTQGYDVEVFKGLGDKRNKVVALQSEISIVPIYKDMPHWTKSVSFFEEAGFWIAGLFPVNRDSHRIIEYDCVMVNAHVKENR